jgi:PhnB protein
MGGVPLPEGYHSVNPYIVVDDAERLIHFLVEVFGAVEQGRALRPDGRSTTAMSASATPW